MAGFELDLVRKAAGLTQGQVGERLEKSFKTVSKFEREADRMTLTSLRSYLVAVGAESATISVTVGGEVIDLPLDLTSATAGDS
ncbi:helix-turn-helix transcriptional regulator [Leifsonia sp. TF02-11]|uniref:helix-turn-helix domain-containing protein n=1 Tax=Leifsonia sp. TF02-11 TaxID=2815212 RepID=UPI001AA11B86|nr:helix-turn-helix transcriptional regulator [Leifsonia sp. TF02-11]MBO1741612.1 helix-turn-helix transcriptional regulator [Leifsonia sp. TF02-11]